MSFSRFSLPFLIMISLTPTRVSPIDPISLALTVITVTRALQGVFSLFKTDPTPPPTHVTHVAGTNITTAGPVTITQAAPTTNTLTPPTATPARVQEPPSAPTTLLGHSPDWKTAVLTAYIALQARLVYLASFLSQQNLPSSLFSHHTLNELLLQPPDNVQQALQEYLFTTYMITNQQDLKLGIARFLRDIDAEVSAITEYQRYCSVGQTVGNAHRFINSQLMWIVGSTIPFVGPLVSKIPLPTIDQFFFLKRTLHEQLTERLSKLIFLKTTFLQTSFIV